MEEQHRHLLNGMKEFLKSLPSPDASVVLQDKTSNYADDILPFDIYRNTRGNIHKIGDQINQSF